MRYVVLLVTFVLCYSYQANSQNRRSRENEPNIAVKNNTFGYFVDMLDLALEYQLKSSESLQLTFKFFNTDEGRFLNLSGNSAEEWAKGFAIGGEYRLYLNGRAKDLRDFILVLT